MAKLEPKHLFDLTFIADPALSPNGRHAAAVHTVIVQDEDEPPRYRSNLFLYNLETGDETHFTRSSFKDTRPRFSPDGTQLAFLSQREKEGKTQLYLMSVTGGEPEALTSFTSGVSSFAWHPAGEGIAFVSRGDWEDEVAENGNARVIDRLHYKMDGTGFRPEKSAQVYYLDLRTKKEKRGEAKQLTSLETDPSSPVFSPDGKTLYFVASPSLDADDTWLSNIYGLELESETLKTLLPEPRILAAPSPSPDGKWVAFFGTRDPDNFGSADGLWRVSSAGGEPGLVSGEYETPPSIGGDSRYGRYPNRAQWLDEGKVVINVNRAGRSSLGVLEPTTQTFAPLTEGNRAVTSFDEQGDTVLFTAETPDRPGELFVLQNGEERRLSHANDTFFEQFDARLPNDPVSVTSSDTDLTYWTLSPVEPREDNALVLQVHGGPHTNYGYGFYFEFHLLAARGYTVVYGNPRGSSSFGSDFATSMQRRYGTLDADDVLAVARHAKQHHTDPDAPLHLTGGSYGGFMTNWLVGHTDEFQSAVTQRSICNWLSFYGASDIGYKFTEQEQGGTPWGDVATLWEQSPLKYAENVTTPTLVLHAEEDHRCPVEQAEQFYVALKRIGKAPTRFIRFPGEGHELSRSGRPDRRIERLNAILDWFEEHE